MAKTKEELEELANECQALSKKMKELSDEEMAIVAGGRGGEATRKIGGYNFEDHVIADNAQVNQDYYITFDDRDSWYRGTIIKIENKSILYLYRYRRYTVRLSDKDGYGCSGCMDFDSDEVTLYRKMYRTWY